MYGHASEVCNLDPKCVVKHLSNDCLSLGKITPTCANCGATHSASCRGCPKNPYNMKKSIVNSKTTLLKKKSLNPSSVLVSLGLLRFRAPHIGNFRSCL